jgi:hypothetical protein
VTYKTDSIKNDFLPRVLEKSFCQAIVFPVDFDQYYAAIPGETTWVFSYGKKKISY